MKPSEEGVLTCDSCGRLICPGDLYMIDFEGTMTCEDCLIDQDPNYPLEVKQ